MVAVKYKTAISTVRIYDEYCETTADRCISHLGRIISASYKRRQLSNGGEHCIDSIPLRFTLFV